METWIFIALAAAVLCVAMVYGTLRKKARQRFKIRQEFGKPPAPRELCYPSIERYWKLQKDRRGCIDEITWSDLEMDRLYERICACRSSVGEEYLYALLHCTNRGEDKLNRWEELLDFLERHPDRREELEMELARLGRKDYNNAAKFMAGREQIADLPFPFLYRLLALLPILSCGFIFISVESGVVCLLLSLALNTAVYYFAKRKLEYFLEIARYVSSILACGKRLEKLEYPCSKELRAQNEALAKARRKSGGLTQHRSTDLDILLEYVRIIFMRDLLEYHGFLKAILEHQEAYQALYRLLGESDSAVSVLSFRKSVPGFCLPEKTRQLEIQAEELYHPLLNQPVTNSAVLHRGWLVTGSNASGKSTFVKALALNAILAKTIHTCTARRMALPELQIVTSMAVRDDILEGDSYFMAEIRSLKRVVELADSGVPCLCVVDEILKGTNTVERIAASTAILRHLAGCNCLCVTASHDIELTELLKEQYDNYHFQEQITTLGVQFDYRLRKGPSKTRNAILLLEHLKFDGRIISSAQQLIQKFETEKKWI